MKKILISILLSLLSLLFIFVACTPLEGGNTSQTTENNSDQVTTDPLETGVESKSETIETTTKEETTNAETEPKETTVKESINFWWRYTDAVFFDYQFTHQPSDADFEKLQKGMTISEVIKIIGRPHGEATNHQRFYWISKEMNLYMLLKLTPMDSSGKELKTYTIFEYCDNATLLYFDKTKSGGINTSPKNDIIARLEDPYLKELPSYDDLMNLPIGMTFKEVIELYGKPQYYGSGIIDGIHRYLFIFYTAEGIEVGVQFYSEKDPEAPWDDKPVNFIISLDPQVYYPEFESPETTAAP